MDNMANKIASFYEAQGAVVHLIYEDADEEKVFDGDASISVQLQTPITYIHGTYVVDNPFCVKDPTKEDLDGR